MEESSILFSALKKSALSLVIPMALIFTVGCKRSQEEESRLTIQIPSANQMNQKYSAQAVLDYNLLCFALDVQGEKIPLHPETNCSPGRGQIAGSVAPGQILSTEIPAGVYQFKLYAIKRASATAPCPVMSEASLASQYKPDQVYLVSQALNQDVSGKEFNMTMVLDLPDESNSLYTTHSYPVSCLSSPGTGTNKAGRAVQGAQKMTSSNHAIYSRINTKPVAKTLNGTNYKIKNWKAGAL